MKRYFLGIIAVMLAAGAVAFKEIKKERNFSEFYFQLSTSPTLSNVVQESNWILAPVQDGSTNCPSGSSKACKIKVDEDYTYMDGDVRKLSSDADITATEVTPGNAIVTGGTGVITAYNRN